MGGNDLELQDQEWNALFDRVRETLRRLSETNSFRNEDYWILDDNWGRRRQEIEIRNLNLLQPSVFGSLQALLADFPEWEIAIGVDVMDKYKGWPSMGLIVRRDEIVDGLQRQHFPQEFQNIVYEGPIRKFASAQKQ